MPLYFTRPKIALRGAVIIKLFHFEHIPIHNNTVPGLVVLLNNLNDDVYCCVYNNIMWVKFRWWRRPVTREPTKRTLSYYIIW